MVVTPISYLLGKFISKHFSNDKNEPKSKLQLIFEKIENPIYKLCGIFAKLWARGLAVISQETVNDNTLTCGIPLTEFCSVRCRSPVQMPGTYIC